MDGTAIEKDTAFARMLITPEVLVSATLATVVSDPLEQIVGQGSTLLLTIPFAPFGTWYSDE